VLGQSLPQFLRIHWSLSIFTNTHAGIVLSSVLHRAAGRSPFLLVLDTKNFEEIAR